MTRLAVLSLLSTVATLTGACASSESEGAGEASTTQSLTTDDSGPAKGPHRRGWRRGPPPQAAEACADSSENASCSFEGRRGTVEGTCQSCPHADGLVCMPEGRGPGHRGRRGPPPQAMEACADAAEGATCSFDGFRGNVQGSCIDHPRADGLVCAPERRSPRRGRGPGGGRGHRGHRGPPPQAIEACASSEAGAECSFDGFRGNVQGTCIDHPRAEGLVCAPERRGPRHGPPTAP